MTEPPNLAGQTPPAVPQPTWGPAPTMTGQPPQPGWYWAPQPQQRTRLGYAGLGCGVGAIILVLLAILPMTVGPYLPQPGRLIIAWTMLVLSFAAAIVGTTLSARGTSRRFINRGAAIAGLVVGIFDLVAWLGLIVVIIVAASM